MAIYHEVAAGGNRLDVDAGSFEVEVVAKFTNSRRRLLELELPVGGRALDLVGSGTGPHHSIETPFMPDDSHNLGSSFVSQLTCIRDRWNPKSL